MGERQVAVTINRDVRNRAGLLALICAAMIAIHLVNIMSGGTLRAYGIAPRTLSGLSGILAAPWLHSNWGHLGNNLASFIVLGGLCLLGGVRYFLRASAIIILVSGLLVWLFGRSGIHAGASAWIFGLWSLTIVRAWYDRSHANLAICLIVLFVYGGMVVGMLPTLGRTSFEGHFFGAVAGVLAAWLLHRRQPQPVVAQPTLKFWD